MNYLHFVTVSAGDCEEAMNYADYWIRANSFQICGVFDLNNPSDFICTDVGRALWFYDVLGKDALLFKQLVLNKLNCQIKPIPEYLSKLSKLFNDANNSEKSIRQLAYNVEQIGKTIKNNYFINDISSQSKYKYEWHKLGLTHLAEECPTHLLLINFEYQRHIW